MRRSRSCCAASRRAATQPSARGVGGTTPHATIARCQALICSASAEASSATRRHGRPEWRVSCSRCSGGRGTGCSSRRFSSASTAQQSSLSTGAPPALHAAWSIHASSWALATSS
eukprot:scaffold267382_cov31-Tisochrysis_lutea.AAC.1